MIFRVCTIFIECCDGFWCKVACLFFWQVTGYLVLPHVVDRAGAFAHVKAGGESAR